MAAKPARRQPPGFVIRDPVFLADGHLQVRLCGHDVRLLLNGQPFASFVEGWRATALFTGFAPLFLLEFTSDTGATATWFLDYRLQHVGDAVARLTDEMRSLLRLRAIPLLRLGLQQVLEQCDAELPAPVRDFLVVNDVTRQAIGAACLDALIPPPASFLAEHLMPHALCYRGDDGALRSIDRDHLAAGLREAWQDRIPGFVRTGRMSWPSPVDGAVVNAQGGIIFDDFHFAFRFADTANRLVFFVVVAEHNSRIAGIWFPSMSLMVSGDEFQRGLASRLIPHLPSWFARHYLQWAVLLVPYLKCGASRFASVMRGRPGTHLGHQLWNELSGIDRLVREAPDALPDWIVLNAADGIEMYGRIDRLFPEINGRVNRVLMDIPSMIRWAHASGVFVLRVTSEFVSADLRDRVRGELSRLPSARIDAIAAREPERPPVVLLGLRVENRTVVDLEGFFLGLLTELMQQFPGIVVVFDGHNARSETDPQVIESHGERAAGPSPADAERTLVATLRTALRDREIRIFDTIGEPIAASVAWCFAADCFVSIWGASLAKYRWVCNKPGFVLSSRMNLLHRGDIDIYSAPRTMESPTSLQFADPDAIHDDPDAAQLINVGPGQPSFFNFRVDVDRILPEIMRMVQANRR